MSLKVHGYFYGFINTIMKINEVTNPLNKYLAIVRVKNSQIKTTIEAESSSNATQLLGKMYGEKNVISVTHTKLDEEVNLEPIPSDIKHERIINDLTNKITNYANKLRPTQSDMNIALKRYKTKQKRVNLELEKQQHLNMLRANKLISIQLKLKLRCKSNGI